MIHKFIFDGTRMVYDVHSGMLHMVDEIAWDILDHFGSLSDEEIVGRLSRKYPEEEIQGGIEEIRELVVKKQLCSPDPLDGRYDSPRDEIVKSLCLHLAHECNLSCSYCFAGQGKFGGSPGIMAAGVGRRALEFLVDSSGGRKHLEVDFFGGEPLLNFDVLRMLVEYGRQLAGERGKEIKFTVTTNAVLLNSEVGAFLNENDISVILSIDGRPEVHNAMRPFPGGAGSYDIVLKNIRSFLKSRGNRDYFVRGTFTALNPDFSSDFLHLADLGFDNISLEPVVAGSGEYYALREDILQDIEREYEKLTRFIIKMKREGRHINFFHFNIKLDGGPCLHRRMAGCGAGSHYLAVDPEGRLYPCHQFVGREEFRLGDVFNGINRKDLVDLFSGLHLYRKENCGMCWAKFHCSGGCHANAYIYNGSLEKPYSLGCGLTRKRLECAMYLAQWKAFQPE
ncbi:MAG: thioether cross-link-forming SCIFF peptide maturase [Bacillota bacterium]